MATKDFRASQIETSKIIASGSVSGSNSLGIVIYSGSVAKDRAGATLDEHMFSDVGSDVFLFVSGSVNKDSLKSEGQRQNVSLFGGDVVISGTLYAERQVIEVDSVADGDFYVTGNMYVKPDANSTKTISFQKADGTELFRTDTVTPAQHLTGNFYVQPSANSVESVTFRNASGVVLFKIDTTNSSILGGTNTTSTSDDVFIGGGVSNTAAQNYAAIVGGANNTVGNYGFIGGGAYNSATQGMNSGASVVGGTYNTAASNYSLVGGGSKNFANANYAIVGGGLANTGSNPYSAVLGGTKNVASGETSAILGGSRNTASATLSAVLASSGSTASGQGTIVIGTELTGSESNTIHIGGGGAAKGYKTVISGSLLVTDDFFLSGSARFKELAGAPNAGPEEAVLYALDDAGTTKLYFKNSAGVQVGPLGSGGSLDDAYDTPDGGGTKASGLGAVITADGQPVQIKVSGANKNALAITGSVIIGSGSSALGGHLPPMPGNDVVFFISGSTVAAGETTSGKRSTRGNTAFGGDIILSGNIHSNSPGNFLISAESSPTSDLLFRYSDVLQMVRNGSTIISHNSTGGLRINTAKTPNVAGDFTVMGDNFEGIIYTDASADSIMIGAAEALAMASIPNVGTDVSVLISGSIGTVGGTAGGTVLVPGDLVTSGSVVLDVAQNIVFGGHETKNSIRSDGPNGNLLIESDNRIIFMSGSGPSAASDPNEATYLDTVFFVSGAIGSKGTDKRGTSVFGGDLVVSGNTRFHNHVVLGGSSTSRLYFDSIGAPGGTYNGPYIDGNTTTLKIDADNRFLNYFDQDYLIIDEQSNNVVTIVSEEEGTGTLANEDANIVFSGSIGSRGTDKRGTSIFGGDVYVSGGFGVNTVEITTDGKLGIGTSPNYKLSVGGNAEFGEYIYHRGDTDTFIQFADDAIGLSAGGVQLVTITEDTQDIVKIGDGTDVDFQVRTLNDDNTLYVQGSSDRVGIGTNAPDSILHVKEAGPTITIQRENNANSSTIEFVGQAGATANMVHLAATNDLVFSTHDGVDQEEIFRLGSHYGTDLRQVILLSGSAMHHGAMHPKESSDINFFVSGAIGSRGTVKRGVSVFGGDTIISGSLVKVDDSDGSLVAELGNPGIILGVKRAIEFGDPAENIFGDGTDLHLASSGMITILSGGNATSPNGHGTDVNFFVSGSTGGRGKVSRSTSVFGGDVFISGSLYSTQVQSYHFAEDITNNSEHYLGIISSGLANTGFNTMRHQMIAPYPGRVTEASIRSETSDGSNPINIKVYSSAGADAVTGGSSTTKAITVSSANSTHSDKIDHSFGKGDAIAISLQRSTTAPNEVCLTLVFEYNAY